MEKEKSYMVILAFVRNVYVYVLSSVHRKILCAEKFHKSAVLLMRYLLSKCVSHKPTTRFVCVCVRAWGISQKVVDGLDLDISMVLG